MIYGEKDCTVNKQVTLYKDFKLLLLVIKSREMAGKLSGINGHLMFLSNNAELCFEQLQYFVFQSVPHRLPPGTKLGHLS